MYNNIEDMTKEQQVINAGTYLIPTLISTILPLISLPIILRSLTPVEYGAYALSISFSTIVVGFCTVSLLNVYQRNYFEYTDEKARAQLLFTIVIFIAFIIIIAGTVVYFNHEYFGSWFIQNKKYGLLLFCTYCGWAFFVINNYYLVYLKNSGNAKTNVMFTVIGNILGVLLNIYFVSFLEIGPLGLALGLLISNVLIFISVNIYFIRKINYSLNFQLLKNSLKLSLPLVPTSVLGSMGKQFDKYIIGVLASVGGTGVFAIGQRITSLVAVFMNALQKVYSPIVYTKMFSNRVKENQRIGKILTPYIYFSVAIALFVCMFSEEALVILAPPEYRSGIGLINLLCIREAISFFAKQPQIMYAGKTSILSILGFINFIFTIFILYFFVNQFGLLGAAAGSLLVSIIYLSMYIYKAQQYYKIYYEWSKLLMIYGFMIIMSIAVLLFLELEFAYLNRLIIKIIFIGIYSALGVYLRILNIENLLSIFKKK